MYKPYKAQKVFEISEFYTAFVRRLNGDYIFSGEIHNFWEFVYVIDGSIVVAADNNVIRLDKNRIIFHKPLEFHNLSAADANGAIVLIVTFNTESDFIKSFNNRIINLNENQAAEVNAIIDAVDSRVQCYVDATLTVHALERFKKDNAAGQRFKNLVENFLISLSTEQEDSPTPLYNTEVEIYKTAVDILNKHKYSSISVAETARLCNVSTAYLKKVFGKYSGLGIHKYFLKIKLSEAKQMLGKGISVSDAADALSFCSQNYFSIVFKREEGISPTEYKKHLKKRKNSV